MRLAYLSPPASKHTIRACWPHLGNRRMRPVATTSALTSDTVAIGPRLGAPVGLRRPTRPEGNRPVTPSAAARFGVDRARAVAPRLPVGLVLRGPLVYLASFALLCFALKREAGRSGFPTGSCSSATSPPAALGSLPRCPFSGFRPSWGTTARARGIAAKTGYLRGSGPYLRSSRANKASVSAPRATRAACSRARISATMRS